MRKSLTLLLLLVFVVLAFYSCGQKKGKWGKEQVVSVLVDSVKKKEMKQFLDLTGQLVGREEVKVFSDLPGRVASIRVVEGQYVAKDTVIAYVDRSQPGVEYALAPVKSPISGYVLSIYVVPGQLVSAGTVAIASVGNINNMDVIISVPERYVKDIKIGQKIYLKVTAYPDEIFEGEIYRKDMAVDPVSRTLTVRGKIYQSKGKLFSGMYGDVSILLREEPSIVVVPMSAIIKTEDNEFAVYVNENKKAVVRKVKIAFTYKENAAILEGLREGEEIVTFGREFLKDGTPINPLKE
ncbi:MAG: efflux RND transporter periplasmic adaptor subunit [Brevinematia bacterium]